MWDGRKRKLFFSLVIPQPVQLHLAIPTLTLTKIKNFAVLHHLIPHAQTYVVAETVTFLGRLPVLPNVPTQRLIPLAAVPW